jgi:LPXTG-motif cell wall-anchored protein
LDLYGRFFSVFGFNNGYGFGMNGDWADMNMIGLNASAGTMTLTFDNPVYAVGGFVNYVPGSGPATLAVYDTSGSLIEATVLTFLAGNSLITGQFVGFLEQTAIGSMTLSNAYIGMTSLTVSSQAVAVPGPVAGAGLPALLGLAGVWFYRRRKAVATA